MCRLGDCFIDNRINDVRHRLSPCESKRPDIGVKMALEPPPSQLCCARERSRFFEQVCRTGDKLKLLFAAKLLIRGSVQIDDAMIFSADDQQGWGTHALQCSESGQIRASSARYNGRDIVTL